MIQGHSNIAVDKFYPKILNYFKSDHFNLIINNPKELFRLSLYNSERPKLEVFTDKCGYQIYNSAYQYTLESNIYGTSNGTIFEISIKIPIYLHIMFFLVLIASLDFFKDVVTEKNNNLNFAIAVLVILLIMLMYLETYRFYTRKEREIAISFRRYIESQESIIINFNKKYNVAKGFNIMVVLFMIYFLFISLDRFFVSTIFVSIVMLMTIWIVLFSVLDTIYEKKSFFSAWKMPFVQIQALISMICLVPLLYITGLGSGFLGRISEESLKKIGIYETIYNNVQNTFIVSFVNGGQKFPIFGGIKFPS